MNKIAPLLILGLSLSLAACTQDVKSVRVMFYNTENFFDTIKDPKTDDAEFTPTGKAQWTSERYQHKLDNISKVLAAMSEQDAPLVIGLSEVENRKVSEDLANAPSLKKYDLGVVEQDSPDPRGIDVALLYSRKLLTITATEYLTVKLPGSDVGTRDILYVKGTVKGTVKGVELHLFVNHWPSRRDGREASAPRRCAAATVLKNKVSAITAADRNARIIIMGDLNDNPTDSSITSVLGASDIIEPYSRDKLYDLMCKPYKEGKYSLRYHQENDVFDQMIVSESLIDKTAATHIKDNEGKIFKEKWMLFNHPKYGEMPNRTYSGPKYHGGFSDHLPVYMDIVFSK
jgi:endonuclease/exonuclease/phosphatase family metal-dependent hydrolase